MKKEYMLAGISILCWSTMATVSKVLLGNLNNIQLLCASSLFAAIFLLGYIACTGKWRKLRDYKGKDYLVMTAIGLPGTFIYYVFYYAGAERMLASQAFIVNYLWPIMSVIFACIILKEKMTARKIIAILISFLGVGIVTGTELTQFNPTTMTGAAFCALGAVSYGIFTAFNQKMKYDKGISMMVSYWGTFLLTMIVIIAKGELFCPNVGQVVGFMWNGMFTMALAGTLWLYVLDHGNTAKISNLAYITPFLSLIWTFVFLKEQISIYSILGLAVIVLGILVQLKDKTEREVV